MSSSPAVEREDLLGVPVALIEEEAPGKDEDVAPRAEEIPIPGRRPPEVTEEEPTPDKEEEEEARVVVAFRSFFTAKDVNGDDELKDDDKVAAAGTPPPLLIDDSEDEEGRVGRGGGGNDARAAVAELNDDGVRFRGKDGGGSEGSRVDIPGGRGVFIIPGRIIPGMGPGLGLSPAKEMGGCGARADGDC